jgi:tetratricopeptide (TPR) repeat protein
MNLVAGVIQRQLSRASARFDSGGKEAGLRAVTGALYLLRAGEYRSDILRGGEAALSAAAEETARIGNEGRSLALYRMLLPLLGPGPRKQDVTAHLGALAQWTRGIESTGVMRGAGARQRTATDRSLLEASPDALEAARQTTVAWMDRSVRLETPEVPMAPGFDPDEMVEAFRARRSGAATLAAIYLRHSDADGAWRAVVGLDPRLVPRGLPDILERAAQDQDPAAWIELYRKFDAAERAETPETAIDPVLARAAAWGIALGLYRINPRSLAGAKVLASQLCDYGMAEVAPHLLLGAMPQRPGVEDLSYALGLVLRGVVEENEIGQIEAARRLFQAAAPLMAMARSPALARKVSPTPARLEYVMGALEAQAGELGRARPHLRAALDAAPTVEAWLLLAGIDRQRGATGEALEELGKAGSLARAGRDEATIAEALLASFEIQRTRGERSSAEKSLRDALSHVLEARRIASSGPGLARAERVLARTLEHYGDLRGARRATERAYEASRSDPREMTATVLAAARRAFSARDLRGAREAARRGIEAGLGGDDLVYVALWLLVLERSLGAPADGTAEDALQILDRTSAWSSKLRAWARGKLSSQMLLSAARSLPERVEASFYAAFDGRSREAVERALSEVASSQAIELVEVTIARDAIASRQASAPFSLPRGLDVP